MPNARIEFPPPLAEPRETAGFTASAVWDYARQFFCISVFFGIGLVVSPLCGLLSRCFPIPTAFGQRLIRRLFGFWLRLTSRLGVFEISFPDVEKLRRMRGIILAPNHPTLIDAVFLLAEVPETVCIMRAQVGRNIFLGGAARLAGYVPNDSGPALIREGMEKIAAGENLLIFPEGTRSLQEAVNPFKTGFALIATRTGAPIQTIFIEREGRYLSKGVSLFAFARSPFRFRIHLGDLVRAAPEESAQQLSARLEQYFRDHLENTGTDIRLKSPLH